MTSERDETKGDQPAPPSGSVASVDLDAIRAVLEAHPVRLAVLFGSQIDGTADPSSDVDLAVELADDVSDVHAERLSLLADLSVALDRDDVDLALVRGLAPRVGRATFTGGHLMFGSEERMAALRERFEAAAAEQESDRSLRERFDATLAAVDRIVEG